ncbi:MAG TPA: phytanoyl-CoA dioxygenase family protein [Caulobacteraceae bacterium]|nr:phytanoyl-CoA dioxygenase family protein [Caulobacteraceae bacterium]
MPATFTLTAEQLEEFDRRGVLRLPGFYPKADIEVMAERLWTDLEQRFGMLRGQPDSWSTTRPAQFHTLVRTGAFDALGSYRMSDLADALLGAGAWDSPRDWGHPLVTFPSTAPDLPRPPWHLDIGAALYLRPMPILRAFTFLEPVLPDGGGTLCVAGSHRLALEMDDANEGPTLRSQAIRERLRRDHPWLAGLFAAKSEKVRELMDADAQVGAQAVRLEEMTGDKGDLIIMHPALLHASAHNALDRPRMMLTTWVYRRGAFAP